MEASAMLIVVLMYGSVRNVEMQSVKIMCTQIQKLLQYRRITEKERHIVNQKN